MVRGTESISRGIVLRKHFPRVCMVSLLDEHYGHIKVVPQGWQWASYAAPGALVSYEIDERDGVLFANNIEVCILPRYTSQTALNFLHHILEICGVWLPVSGGGYEIFALVLTIIDELKELEGNVLAQKVALAKLLFLCGQYPEDSDRLPISLVLHQTYAKLQKMTFNDVQQRELAIFIYRCFAQHPAGKWLKTVNFLTWDMP